MQDGKDILKQNTDIQCPWSVEYSCYYLLKLMLILVMVVFPCCIDYEPSTFGPPRRTNRKHSKKNQNVYMLYVLLLDTHRDFLYLIVGHPK